jgi:hypothetical protein
VSRAGSRPVRAIARAVAGVRTVGATPRALGSVAVPGVRRGGDAGATGAIRGGGRIATMLLAAALLAGCAGVGLGTPAGLADVAGEWRGRWSGPAGHALAALSVEPSGAYRARMFLDGGDRDAAGVIIALPSGRLRYQGGDGNGEVRLETSGGVPTLRLFPDGGGGGGTFRRAP